MYERERASVCVRLNALVTMRCVSYTVLPQYYSSIHILIMICYNYYYHHCHTTSYLAVLLSLLLLLTPIAAVRFHANGSLLLAGGEDKHLRFFRIDGETNEKQLSTSRVPLSFQLIIYVQFN